jgi:hypothetical protein
MRNRSMLRVAGTWIEVAEVVMQGAIVVYLTVVPAAATEPQAVPLKATAIAFDARTPKAMAIILDAQSAGTNCVPMDWAHRARLVTAS